MGKFFLSTKSMKSNEINVVCVFSIEKRVIFQTFIYFFHFESILVSIAPTENALKSEIGNGNLHDLYISFPPFLAYKKSSRKKSLKESDIKKQLRLMNNKKIL